MRGITEDDLLDALPTPEGYDPRLLTAAARAGRIRGAVLDLWGRAVADPMRAESTFRKGLREARQLHSRERRLVGDALRELARHRVFLDAALDTDHPLARWLGWLVVQGLPVADAEAAWREAGEGATPGFAALADPREVGRGLLTGLDDVDALALFGSLPRSVAEELVAVWGGEAGRFLAASNRRAPVVLRANRARIGRDALLERLTQEGLVVRAAELAVDAVVLDKPANVEATRAFKEGLFEVQDEGSQLLVELTDPVAEPVVDFCAGAGGKSLALSAAMNGRGRIVALDVRDRALKELRRRARRARVHNIRAQSMLAHGPLPAAAWDVEGQAMRVLVDAPCSGTGVLRRHPEHRLRLDDGTVGRFAGMQRKILDRAAPLVAPGGRLVYATCSVLPREDEAVVDAFLQDNPAFRRVPVTDVLGAERARELGAVDVLRVAPHTHGTDGFFGAVLERER